MTDTVTAPLPTDLAKMRAYYLPPEPCGTSVTALRGAIARIDVISSEIRSALERITELDRALVGDFIDAAVAGEDLDPYLAQLEPGNRADLAHQLDQLDHARATATNRLAHAERSDVDHLAWVAECKQIYDEWNYTVNNAEDESQRFDALCRFVDRYRR